MKAYVKGDAELIGALQALRKTHLKRAVRKGSRAAAKIEAARAKQLVPVQTGALKREIKVRAIKRSKRWTGTQVTTKVAGGPVYYGGFVELGTRKLKARHHLKRAAEAAQGQATTAFIDGIREDLSRVP